MKKVLVLVVLIAVFFIFKPKSDPAKDAADRERWRLESQRIGWIAKGKATIAEKLKDPDSAKFRNVFYSKSGGTHMTCGEVNSKNGFGAYGGFQRFLSAGRPDLTFLEEQATDFGAVWEEFCK